VNSSSDITKVLCTEVNDGGTLTATTPTSNGICNA
jgi:hypothetical protein